MNILSGKIIAALGLLLMLVALTVIFVPAAFADPSALQQIENNNVDPSTTSTTTDPKACDNTTNANGTVNQAKVQNCVTQTPIVHDIQTIVDFLSAGVGIIVTGVIIVGGIQYTLAGGNATALTAARQRITNGLIALFAFLFIFAFLQWLIPGGIFK